MKGGGPRPAGARSMHCSSRQRLGKVSALRMSGSRSRAVPTKRGDVCEGRYQRGLREQVLSFAKARKSRVEENIQKRGGIDISVGSC